MEAAIRRVYGSQATTNLHIQPKHENISVWASWSYVVSQGGYGSGPYTLSLSRYTHTPPSLPPFRSLPPPPQALPASKKTTQQAKDKTRLWPPLSCFLFVFKSFENLYGYKPVISSWLQASLKQTFEEM